VSDDISLAQLAHTVAALNDRLADIDHKLDDLTESVKGLASMTARAPDGRTLINLVGTILNKVGG
jgi:hypothetical protein